ncbi:sensor histidine kinase [Kordia jejudonensis]|uniref:sensor histidine kinase n=1 Tax=Kordia jejudonensis TaxID=1348245 RepID=UPI0006290D13|nr:GAF domain-containing sensor histidine kinase [Kordia jejudonensis]
MISPSFPKNEKQRQKAVEKYQLLDTLPEESFDNITSLMSYICEVPISLVTLLDYDRNFLKSHYGIPFSESPREISFCGHAINAEGDMMTVYDAREDERFHDNPLVAEHNAIFYAGVPLVDPDGFKLGTLCVYDVKPRILTQAQVDALKAMAKQVVSLFDERYKNIKLLELQADLQKRNIELERFAGVVSHDLKSPLAQIRMLTQLVEEEATNLSEETLQYLEYIKTSSDSLRDYIDGILKFYKADTVVKNKKEEVAVAAIEKEIQNITNSDKKVSLLFETALQTIHVNRAGLTQILLNLVSNAIKYNDKENPSIQVQIFEQEEHYQITVVDNGPGIPETAQEQIFELFTTAQKTDKFGNAGTGIGLATVKKVVIKLGGIIVVSSKMGHGSQFVCTLAK